jgi:tetratricopeptide (TPR) repeat protein
MAERLAHTTGPEREGRELSTEVAERPQSIRLGEMDIEPDAVGRILEHAQAMAVVERIDAALAARGDKDYSDEASGRIAPDGQAPGTEGEAAETGQELVEAVDGGGDEVAAEAALVGSTGDLQAPTKSPEDQARLAPGERPVPVQPVGSARLAQTLSDDARMRDLGYYNAVPIVPDGGRGSVASAAAYAAHHRGLAEKEVVHTPRVCEVGADTGIPTRQFLDALRRDDPGTYEETRVTVFSPHATVIEASGIFSEHADKVDIVRMEAGKAPRLPEGTLMAIITGAEYEPVHRLASPQQGTPVEILTKTQLAEGTPMMTIVEDADGSSAVPAPVRPETLLTFNTATADSAARSTIDAKLRPLMHEEVFDPTAPGFPNRRPLHGLARADETVAEVMQEVPADRAHMIHYSQQLENIVAGVVAQLDAHGLCVVAGPMRETTDFESHIPWNRQSRPVGDLLSNVIEVGTLQRGAQAADSHATVQVERRPPQQQGKYNYALIVRNGSDQELAGPATQAFRDIVRAPSQVSQMAVLNRARDALAAEAGSADPGAATAIIRATYDAYLATGQRDETGTLKLLPQLDAEVASRLAVMLGRHGEYAEAIFYADQAIRIAPHAAIVARRVRAEALLHQAILSGQDTAACASLAQAAREELDAAYGIAPRYAELHRLSAACAKLQGNWGGYSDALIALQRDAGKLAGNARVPATEIPRITDNPEEDPFAAIQVERVDGTGRPLSEAAVEAATLAELWRSALIAQERDAANGSQDRVEVRVERPVYDEANRHWTVEPEVHLMSREAYERMRIARIASQVLGVLHRHVSEVASNAPKQWQDRIVAPIIEIAARNRAHETVAAISPWIREGFLLVGEAAELAEEFDAVHPKPEPAPPEAPRLTKPLEEYGIRAGFSLPDVVYDPRDGRIIGNLDLYFRRVRGLRNNPDIGDHLIIAGTTDSGKSTTGQTIMLNVVRAGRVETEQGPIYTKKVVVMELGDRAQHGALGEVMSGVAGVTEIRYRDNDPELALALLTPEPGVSMQQHIALVRLVLLLASNATEPYPQITGSALQNLMADLAHAVSRSDGSFKEEASDVAVHPSMSEFIDEVINYTGIYEGGDAHGNVKGFLKARLEELMSGDIGPRLQNRNALDIGDTYDNHPVVRHVFSDIKNQSHRMFMAALVFLKMFEHAQMLRAAGGDADMEFDHLIFWEEAQSLFNTTGDSESLQGKIVEVFLEAIRQIRGYGVGNAFSVQDASQLPSGMLSQIATTVLTRQDEGAAEAVLRGTGAGPEDYHRLANLANGEIIFRRSSVDPRPGYARLPMPPRGGMPDEVPPVRVRDERYTPEGGFYSVNEVREASIDVLRAPYAWWRLYATMAVLAHATNNPLPDVPPEMRAMWAAMPPRERALKLDLVANNAVVKRQHPLRNHYDPSKLVRQVLHDAVRSLEGVPIAGRRPGASLVAPELAIAVELQRLNDPWLDVPPDPESYDGYVPDYIPGFTEALAAVRGVQSDAPPRVKEVVAALERMSTSVAVASKTTAATNHGRALQELIGDDLMVSLQRDLAIVTNNEPNTWLRYLAAAEAMGLWVQGSPMPPWFAVVMATPDRVIRLDGKQPKRRGESSPKPQTTQDVARTALQQSLEFVSAELAKLGEERSSSYGQKYRLELIDKLTQLTMALSSLR